MTHAEGVTWEDTKSGVKSTVVPSLEELEGYHGGPKPHGQPGGREGDTQPGDQGHWGVGSQPGVGPGEASSGRDDEEQSILQERHPPPHGGYHAGVNRHEQPTHTPPEGTHLPSAPLSQPRPPAPPLLATNPALEARPPPHRHRGAWGYAGEEDDSRPHPGGGGLPTYTAASPQKEARAAASSPAVSPKRRPVTPPRSRNGGIAEWTEAEHSETESEPSDKGLRPAGSPASKRGSKGVQGVLSRLWKFGKKVSSQRVC